MLVQNGFFFTKIYSKKIRNSSSVIFLLMCIFDSLGILFELGFFKCEATIFVVVCSIISLFQAFGKMI
jgi:hypothetical protein